MGWNPLIELGLAVQTNGVASLEALRKRQQQEQARLAQLNRQAQEQKRLAEQKKQQEALALALAQQKADNQRLKEEAEQKRLAEQKRQQQEQDRLAKLRRQAQEQEQKRLAEQKKQQEALALALAQQKAEDQYLKEEAERKRLAEQKRQQQEQARLAELNRHAQEQEHLAEQKKQQEALALALAQQKAENQRLKDEAERKRLVDYNRVLDLIKNYVAYYNEGNLQAFTNLFDINASDNETHGKRAISDKYRQFFSNNAKRDLNLTIDSATPKDDGYLLQGSFHLALESEKGGVKTYTGDIEITTIVTSGALVISRLSYAN